MPFKYLIFRLYLQKSVRFFFVFCKANFCFVSRFCRAKEPYLFKAESEASASEMSFHGLKTDTESESGDSDPATQSDPGESEDGEDEEEEGDVEGEEGGEDEEEEEDAAAGEMAGVQDDSRSSGSGSD